MNLSDHILSSSANLMGICFLIFTFVKTLGKHGETLLDELALCGLFVFLTASILSYLSLRQGKRVLMLEKAADLIFVFGLLVLAATSIVVALEIK